MADHRRVQRLRKRAAAYERRHRITPYGYRHYLGGKRCQPDVTGDAFWFPVTMAFGVLLYILVASQT